MERSDWLLREPANYHAHHPRPQAQARAALTVALGQAVEQLIVIGSFALKECCGWEGNAG